MMEYYFKTCCFLKKRQDVLRLMWIDTVFTQKVVILYSNIFIYLFFAHAANKMQL